LLGSFALPSLDRNLSLPGLVSIVGLNLPDDLPFAEWQQIGETLRGVERSLMWWIGDWLRYGERRYGEMYTQALEATDKKYQTLRDAQWVAGAFELSRRRDNLSWSHHRDVAALPREVADELLDEAERCRLSRNDLRKRVSQAKVASRIGASVPSAETCSVSDLSRLAEEGRTFGTIYADPPWLYDNQGTRAATGNHYNGMTIDELCALPIGDLAAPDAHLHLWTTNGFIFECKRIFDAWGFEFRSSFVWVKPQMGIGNYWRNSHEFLLTAIRGDAKRFNDHSIKSWLECDRGAHSAKPEMVRHFIERASPGPYLELFGRSLSPKWTVWGNQIERTIFNHDARHIA
jgi:N6-adenosine-specific RNA methylase IME4